MKWWKRYLRDTDQDTNAADAVCEAQARLDQVDVHLEAVDALEEKVDTVVSNIEETGYENHFVIRLRETYRRELGDRSAWTQ